MPLFSYPLFAIAAISLPLLIIIYKLRNQPKSHIVSSLMLWKLQKQPDTGGRILKSLPFPLTLLLELIILLLLVIAATTPLILSGDAPPPLVIILDDSYSMLAGNKTSARDKGVEAITEELKHDSGRSINILLAGDNISTLGPQTTVVSSVLEQLKGWHCRAPQSKINDAIAFTHKMYPKHTEILVVSDSSPDDKEVLPGVKWIAVGEPLGNEAFINATRTSYGERERYLFEISNISDHKVETTLSLHFKNSNAKPRIRPVTIKAMETRKIIMELPASLRPLVAQLSDDQLSIDNTVTLMPQPKQRVKVQLKINDESIRKMVLRALELTNSSIVDSLPDFIITERRIGAKTINKGLNSVGNKANNGFNSGANNNGATEEAASRISELSPLWTLQINTVKVAKAYTGPFIVDKNNPINDGVFLDGVIWGASDRISLSGIPLISAANIPLFSETIYNDNTRLYQLQIAPELSTLKDSSAWPVLIWNLIEQRRIELPGVTRVNYRLGNQAHISLGYKAKRITIATPSGDILKLKPQGGEVVLDLDQTGVWEVSSSQAKYKFCVNTLLFEESDLQHATTTTINGWEQVTSAHEEYRSIAWIFLLIALFVLSLHLYVLRRRMS